MHTLLFLVGPILGVVGFFVMIAMAGLGSIQDGILFLAGVVLVSGVPFWRATVAGQQKARADAEKLRADLEVTRLIT
jgi:hypothetical protein